MFKPIDGLEKPFKVSLLSAQCSFHLFMDMFFHMLYMSFTMLSNFLIVAYEFFPILQVFQVPFFRFHIVTYGSQEIFAHQVFHEVRAFRTYIVALIMF